MTKKLHVGKLERVPNAQPSTYQDKEGYLVIGHSVYAIQDKVVPIGKINTTQNLNGNISYSLPLGVRGSLKDVLTQHLTEIKDKE